MGVFPLLKVLSNFTNILHQNMFFFFFFANQTKNNTKLNGMFDLGYFKNLFILDTREKFIKLHGDAIRTI